MLIRKFQAKHLPDAGFLLILQFFARRTDDRWMQIWDLERLMPHIPEKLIRAKMGQLIKRGLVDGCACGCRGDFYITPAGNEYLLLVFPKQPVLRTLKERGR